MTVKLSDIEKKLAARTPGPAEQKDLKGDHSLNPGMPVKDKLRDAAVLILLVERPEGLAVLFTERTKTLHAHAGQISFPGGGTEAQDADNKATALRESAEEIGLVPGNARVIGELDDYVTRTGFRVKPVIAVLEKDQEWAPSPDEVAKIFEVPLDYILANLVEETLNFEGGERRFYACTFEGNHIWGATAGMLKSLAGVLSGPPANGNAPPQKKPDAKNGTERKGP